LVIKVEDAGKAPAAAEGHEGEAAKA
jgi:hypothetical protein